MHGIQREYNDQRDSFCSADSRLHSSVSGQLASAQLASTLTITSAVYRLLKGLYCFPSTQL